MTTENMSQCPSEPTMVHLIQGKYGEHVGCWSRLMDVDDAVASPSFRLPQLAKHLLRSLVVIQHKKTNDG